MPIGSTMAAILAGAAIAGGVGTSMYSASQESKAAKKAAEAQKQVSLAQIEAAAKSEETALDKARTKLKARQAGRTETILTSPMGMEEETATTRRTLGV